MIKFINEGSDLENFKTKRNYRPGFSNQSSLTIERILLHKTSKSEAIPLPITLTKNCITNKI